MSERKSLAIREVLGAFSSDRNQPADPGLCGGSRRSPKITVRLRVLVGAGVLRNLRLGHYFPPAFAAIARHIPVAGFLNARLPNVRVGSFRARCSFSASQNGGQASSRQVRLLGSVGFLSMSGAHKSPSRHTFVQAARDVAGADQSRLAPGINLSPRTRRFRSAHKSQFKNRRLPEAYRHISIILGRLPEELRLRFTRAR